jgi:hypothetical protein
VAVQQALSSKRRSFVKCRSARTRRARQAQSGANLRRRLRNPRKARYPTNLGLPRRIMRRRIVTPATAQRALPRSLFLSNRALRLSHARSLKRVRGSQGHMTDQVGVACIRHLTRMTGGHRESETVAITTTMERIQVIMSTTIVTRDTTNLRATAALTLTFQVTSRMRTIVAILDHPSITSTMPVSMGVREIEQKSASALPRVRRGPQLPTDYRNDLLHPLPDEDATICIDRILLIFLLLVVGAVTQITTIILVLLGMNTYLVDHVHLRSSKTVASQLHPPPTQPQPTIFRELTGNFASMLNYALQAGQSPGGS